ncbi:WXG100 family type VII secretion target [Streptomyces sp. NBC_01136]|uniref:WXG100 family type VII secretion target n=1 Tax=unclassified Streptomyces TaxID=2593676 RepID=UPI00325212C8|nr:WXG100 family type VII secretion target [Streptomyces sp. NBC_01136]
MASVLPNYDTADIKMDPAVVSDAVKALIGGDPYEPGGLVADVIDKLEDVLTQVKDLTGWAGDSATEAQDFIDRWHSATEELIGSKQKPDGVLQRVVKGLATATANYEAAEDFAIKIFSGFKVLGGTDSTNAAPTSVTNASPDDVVTAITETF